MPLRNLLRHKREYPLPVDRSGSLSGFPDPIGQDPSVLAGEDDYELRRARTPVPPVFERAIRLHLARIYGREIQREVESEVTTDGPVKTGSVSVSEAELVQEWWADVDGSGRMPVDKWMRQEFAPVFLSLGQLDVLFDRPMAPMGAKVETQADVADLGLDAVRAALVLPDRVLNWKCDEHGYVWVLIQECHEDDDGNEVERYRHWSTVDSVLYDADGNVLQTTPHPYGRPPVVRVFDRRDRRCKHIGRSNYESIAELMRSIYNRASELVLSDVLQAFPIMQAPADMLDASSGVPVGPGWILPMTKSGDTWQGIQAVDLPKGSIESLRTNMQADLAQADREAGLVKPAGAESGDVTAQSGLSKSFDYREGQDLLSARSETLAEAEREFVRMALTVRLGRPIPCGAVIPVQVVYPTEFDLLAAGDIVDLIDALDKATASVGDLPELQIKLLKRFARAVLKGEQDTVFDAVDDEIEAYVMTKARQKAVASESLSTMHGHTIDRGGIDVADTTAADQPGSGATGQANQDPETETESEST